MRLESVNVRNYRGLRSAVVTGVAEQPVVTVAGVNGSGKTLLLEAISTLWRSMLNASDVGPFGDEASIRVEFVLEPHEVKALENTMKPDHRGRTPIPGLTAGTCPSTIPVEITRRRDEHNGRRAEQAEPWANVLLRRITPVGDTSFLAVDYLPANRLLATNEAALPNPGMVGPNFSLFNQSSDDPFFRFNGLLSWLATVDYMDLLAEREGRQSTRDFMLLADRFK